MILRRRARRRVDPAQRPTAPHRLDESAAVHERHEVFADLETLLRLDGLVTDA
jgi:hypothetical protein